MSLWYVILIVVLTLALPIVEKRVKSEAQEEGEDLYLGHQEDDALDVMEEPEMDEVDAVVDEEAEEVEADYQYLVQPGIPEPVKVPAPAVVQVDEEPAAVRPAVQPVTVQPATLQSAIAQPAIVQPATAEVAAVHCATVQQDKCLEEGEETIGKRSSLKERLKSNPKDMILLSEILKPKYKEY